MVSAALVAAIFEQHHMKKGHSIHFVDHWARVLENGRKLAPLTGARLDVVELFSVFHDAGRQNDGYDDRHGARGSLLARDLRGILFDLDHAGFHLLVEACDRHTEGETDADVTIQTCWDADRLDLGRAGYIPKPAKLCTSAARDSQMIEWAHNRSTRFVVPGLVLSEWGLCKDRSEIFVKCRSDLPDPL